MKQGCFFSHLDPDRLAAGELSHVVNEVYQSRRTVEGRVEDGRITICPHIHTPRLGDSSRHFAAREDSPVTWLGPLRELQLDHLCGYARVWVCGWLYSLS